jgi:hypothetical protein
MDPGKLMQRMLVASGTLLAIVMMFWLQSKFEGADRKAALGMALTYRARGGWTIPDILDARHPGHAPVWDVQTQSSCLHHYEKVSADIDGVRYQFMVDIDGPSIHPGNPESEPVLKQLDEPRPAPPPAASQAAP